MDSVIKVDQFLRSKIYKACGKDDFRPVIQHVLFSEGKVIATDSGPKGGIIVTNNIDGSDESEQFGLIMPVYLHN